MVETEKSNAEKRKERERLEIKRRAVLRDALYEIVESTEITAAQKLLAAEMIMELDGKRSKKDD